MPVVFSTSVLRVQLPTGGVFDSHFPVLYVRKYILTGSIFEQGLYIYIMQTQCKWIRNHKIINTVWICVPCKEEKKWQSWEWSNVLTQQYSEYHPLFRLIKGNVHLNWRSPSWLKYFFVIQLYELKYTCPDFCSASRMANRVPAKIGYKNRCQKLFFEVIP